MRIHVVCGSEMTKSKIAKVKAQLDSLKGPLVFSYARMDSPDVAKSRKLYFSELFSMARTEREKSRIPPEDFVIVLTEYPNSRNFFAALEPHTIRDGFVHAGEWEKYTDADPAIPSAFTILNIVLLGIMVDAHEDIRNVTHDRPIACIMDMCNNKREVAYKLRTADICMPCMNLMIRKNISPLVIDQSLRLLDNMRNQMAYRNYFHREFKPSRLNLQVRGEQNAIVFKDYDQTQVKLTELQMALYILFLLHPEGIRFKNLVAHRKTLAKIYISTAGATEEAFKSELQPPMEKAIRPVKGSASEHLSKVNKAILDTIGENFASPYLVGGQNGREKKIELPREYVIDFDILRQKYE